MIKPNLKELLKLTQLKMEQNAPQIMTGIGIAGMVGTVVLAVKATPKALKLIEEVKEEKLETLQEEEEVKLTTVETVKATWKPYIPATLTGLTSIAFLVGSCSVNTRRIAALTTVYKLSESALLEYKDAVVETIGEKKAEKVREQVAKNKIESNPVSKQVVFETHKGNTLCYDPLCDRYFRSDMNSIKKAENQLKSYLLSDDYISVNTFYDFLNLKHSELGDIMGWNVNRCGYVDVEVRAMIADNDEPCLVLDFSEMPVYEYAKF